MEHMMKLLAKKKKEGADLSDNERNAKISVLHDLRGQAAKAMGERLHGIQKDGGSPKSTAILHGLTANADVLGKDPGEPEGAAHQKGPGDHESPEHGTVHGESNAHGPGEEYPEHGSEGSDAHEEAEGPGDHHPESGSEGGDSAGEAEGPGDHHPLRGSLAGESHAMGPGDHGSPEHGSEGEEFHHMGVEELDKHISKLMAHKKRLEGKGK